MLGILDEWSLVWPVSRRYRVSFRHADGAIDAVTVWADDSRLAQQIARDWIEQAALQPVSDAEPRTEEIGAEPDPGDIGVAASYAAVNHERLSADGISESTLHRPSLDELRLLTELMRTETCAGWEELRGLLRESDIDPRRTAAVTLAIDSKGFPDQVRMVTSDGKVIMFFSGAHPIVRGGLPVLDESGAMQFEQGPSLVALDPNVRDPSTKLALSSFERRGYHVTVDPEPVLRSRGRTSEAHKTGHGWSAALNALRVNSRRYASTAPSVIERRSMSVPSRNDT